MIFRSQFFICIDSFAQWKTVHDVNIGGDTLPSISELSFSSAADGITACRTINSYRANSRNVGSIITTNDSESTWTYRLEVVSFYFQKVIHADTNIALAIRSQRNYKWDTYNKRIYERSINSGVT
ncbi:MAG: hypothetical protein ACI91R_000185 [Vicingaceae bacterium]